MEGRWVWSCWGSGGDGFVISIRLLELFVSKSYWMIIGIVPQRTRARPADRFVSIGSA